MPPHVRLFPDRALAHFIAAGDQVDQRAEERDEEQDGDPAGLAPSRHLVIAKEVADDDDQDPEVEDQKEELEDGEQPLSERVVGERKFRTSLPWLAERAGGSLSPRWSQIKLAPSAAIGVGRVAAGP